MKRNFYTIFIALILLATIVWAQIFAESTLDETSKKIQQLYNSLNNTENILTEKNLYLATDIDIFWTNKERILCLVINHNDLNKIGEQIKKVIVYIKQNDKKNCVYEIETLKFYTESYKNVMDIKPENLL